jgi:ABC-type sulfate transport system permease component
VFLGGVDPGLVLLSGAGLASTALAAAAISVVASVGARTRGRGVSIAVGLVLTWFALPSAFLALRMLLWTGGPRWLTQAALWLLDTSPFGVGLSLLGVMPRPSSIIESVLRMTALETAGAAGRAHPAATIRCSGTPSRRTAGRPWGRGSRTGWSAWSGSA